MFVFYPERTRLMFTCSHSLISTDNFRRALTASADSCTEMKECSFSGVTTVRVPGEIKRREVEVDPQPRRDHEQGDGAGLRKLDFFRFGLFLNSSATDIVFVSLRLKQQLRGALVAAQWRRDTALTLPLFWRRSTVSPVFFGRYPRSSLHSLAAHLNAGVIVVVTV